MVDETARCRSWFCELGNPVDVFEGTPEETANHFLNMWIEPKASRSGAVAYCVSADGFHHLHMVLCDTIPVRFSALKKLYGKKIHIEPTRGSKEQAEDYIYKRGIFAQKGEKVLFVAVHGELSGKQVKRKDLDAIEEMLEQGKTPSEIMAMSFTYRQYERMIKNAFYDLRRSNTPMKREIYVEWHVGASGTGKSHCMMDLAKKYTEDEIYVYTDFAVGGLDTYAAEKILFMDEFRGQIPYSTLLTMLDGYKVQLHARYGNVWSLWEQVHITSVLSPDMLYKKMVDEYRDVDTFAQLARRINTITYHWKDKEGNYKKLSIPMTEYKSLDALRAKAVGTEWIPMDDIDVDENPFEKGADEYEYHGSIGTLPTE